jgi:hypothetical protein
VQGTLDFAAKIGVAGCVDQVDTHALVGDLSGLGENRDSALAFLVVRVHHPIDDLLVGGEGSGAAQKRVDEGGLTVVDVRDESNVATGGHVA